MNDQKPTFKEAMEATMIWCKSWENDEISDEVISDRIGELIKTVEGARGFFVVSLSICLLYTSPSPRDQRGSRMPSSA